MAKTIKPADLGKALSQELDIYNKGVIERVNEAGRNAAKQLVKLTKAKAPTRTGDFKKHIASREDDAGNGMKKFTWYVRPPKHRITHLVVHGHVKPGGGRVKGDPFLADALAQVLPEYEQAIEEAVKNK